MRTVSLPLSLLFPRRHQRRRRRRRHAHLAMNCFIPTRTTEMRRKDARSLAAASFACLQAQGCGRGSGGGVGGGAAVVTERLARRLSGCRREREERGEERERLAQPHDHHDVDDEKERKKRAREREAVTRGKRTSSQGVVCKGFTPHPLIRDSHWIRMRTGCECKTPDQVSRVSSPSDPFPASLPSSLRRQRHTATVQVRKRQRRSECACVCEKMRRQDAGAEREWMSLPVAQVITIF